MLAVLWVIGSAVVGYLGRHREFGFWGFFLASLLVSPVIVLVVLLVSKTADPPRGGNPLDLR
ncbi:MAG TPA: hypothetical protein VH394_04270 [Thermoanaerobaculia bacterium]|jgi:hypothetical protein|nr:hypothetical protein [Thermoanaerobaculia bacterium]